MGKVREIEQQISSPMVSDPMLTLTQYQRHIAWLLEELDRVWGYAYHLNDCAVVDSPANKCTCGLNDLESGHA
jgi:hypothetical protein